MKASYLVVILLFLCPMLMAQTIKGVVCDESKHPLIGASIMGMKFDSSLVKFSTSNENGEFEVDIVELIQITYLGYESYWLKLNGKELSSLLLDTIVLTPQSTELSAVHIEAKQNRLLLNGDTVNYSTNLLAVKPGDVVEDILDQLPGVEVQPDGTVKAFGEKVQNVLVDGHEFFGKDTRMATKNLAAEAVDQVQVFDKASDYSEFTGVADGQDEKSINLKLKEDYKNGHFGQIDLGAGSEKRFAGRGNFNQFGKNHRISFIGLGNNRNEPGFTMQQYLEFMGGLESFASDYGRVEIDLNDQAGLPLGNTNEPGIHTRQTTGINYKGMWSPNMTAQFHYLYNFNKNHLQERIHQQSLIQDDVLNAHDTTELQNISNFHNINTKLKYDFSKNHNITWSCNASLGHENQRITRQEQNGTLNQSESFWIDRAEHHIGQSQILTSSLNYKLRFKKKYSLLTNLQAIFHSNDHVRHQLIQSTPSKPTGSFKQFVLQEEKLFNRSYNARVSLVWPLSKNWSLDFGIISRKLTQDLKTPWYAGENSSSELSLIQDLSGNIQREENELSPNWKLRFKNQSWNFTFNLQHSWQVLHGSFENTYPNFKRKYNVWLPGFFTKWELGQSQSLNFEYFTDLILPTTTQLQPVPNMIDPLNIYLGNPELKAMYQHEFSLRYFDYDQFDDATTYARVAVGKIFNQINHLVSSDSLFRITHQPINTQSMQNFSVVSEHSRPLGWGNITVKLRSQIKYRSGIVKIEEDRNHVTNVFWKVGAGIGHRKVYNWKWGAYFDLINQSSKYSINKNFNQDFATLKTTLFLEYIPTNHWSIRLSNTWNSFEHPINEETTSLYISNLSVTRFFTPERKFRITLHAYDLFDQNTGVNRFAEANAIIDHRYNAIGRHFMLTLGYNIRGHKRDDNNAVNIRVGGAS